MVRFTVNVPDDLFNALQEAAGQSGKNLGELVAECLARAYPLLMAEKAEQADKRALPSLTVVEKHSYRELGYLGDVSAEGIMIIANEPLPLEQTLDVLIALPDKESFEQRVIEMQIEARWYKRDASKPELYCVGCQFLHIAPTDLERLTRHSSRLDLSADSGKRSARTHLVFYLDVVDPANGRLLGHVGDISNNGIMLIAEHPLPLKQVRDVRIKLPELEEFPRKFIDVQVETRWTKPDVNPQLHCIGCLFVQISLENISLVRQVQDLLKLG